MTRLRLALLGGFHARLGTGAPLPVPIRKGQALLAYLALPLGQPHARDQLGALLWGDLRAESARNNIRQVLFELRRSLGRAASVVLRLEGEAVALDPTAVEVDVAEFEQRVAEGTPAALARAAALYQGDLLAGIGPAPAPFEEWLLGERERLHELALETFAKLLTYQRRAAPGTAAIQTAMRLLILDPLQEATHRALMQLYVGTGRRDAALRQYQVCLDVLDRELGVEPEAETKALYQEILRRRRLRLEAAAGASGAPPESEAHAARTTLMSPSADAPLLGRAQELAWLRDELASAWAEAGGGPRLSAILGEAGMGKSRLVAELAAEAVGRGGRVLLGHAYETDQILPFGPWMTALRPGAGVPDADTLRGLDPRVRRDLARLFPELPRPEAPLAELEPRRLFDGLVQFLESLARVVPRLIVLEDLHWADEMSVRFLAYVGRQLRATPTLVVLTARAEDLAEAPLLRRTLEDLEREGRLARLALAPLSHADTRALVQALTRPGVESTAVNSLGEAIWTASRGNPFMIVELVRALREGTTILTPSGLTLPTRVEEMIARRLERLGARSRALVGVAALIAHAVDFPLLQRASGLGELDAAEGLEELVRRRILEGVGERFAFTHDAIRVVAARQLLGPRARVLHRRVAEALESLQVGDPERSAAALGRHYREAEVWDQAVRYLRLAGVNALARAAHREARAAFEQAREAIGHLPEGRERLAQAVDVRIDLYQALVPLGAPREIAQHLQEAERFALALDDPARLGRVVAYATNTLWLAGDSDRAREWGTRAVALAETLDDFGLRTVACFYLAQVHHFRGEYREAIGLLRRTVASLAADQGQERFGLPGLPAVLARGWLAWSLAEVGEFVEGLARGEEAVQLAEAIDHAFSRADAYRELGCLHLRKGDLRAALAVLERGLTLCRGRELTLWFPSLGGALGYTYMLAGRVAEGTALLESALEQATSLGIRVGQAIRSAWLGESHLRAGRVDDAMRLARQAVDLARAHRERGYEAWALRLLGEIAAQGDSSDLEIAETCYGQALALAGDLGMRPLVAHCHLGLGVLYRRIDDRARVKAELATAVTMFRELSMEFYVAQAEATLREIA